MFRLTLSAPGIDRRSRIVFRPDAAADRQRNEDPLGHCGDRVGQRPPALERRGDVEDDDLVDALLVVSRRELGRIAGIPQALEVDALDDLAVPDVEAGDDSLRQH